MNRLGPAIGFLCLVSSAALHPLTVEEAVGMAVANNLEVRSERIALEGRRRARDTAWNVFIPDVRASGSLGRLNRDPNAGDDPLEMLVPGYTAPETSRWSLATAVSATLSLNTALVNGINQTILDYEAGTIALETARRRVSRDVRKNFHNLILLRENIALMEENIATAARRYEQSLANYEAGLVSEYTLLAAQVSLENLRPTLQDMQIGYQTVLMGFLQSLGLERDAPVDIEGSIDAAPVLLDADDLIRRYAGNRLELQGLRNTLARLENQRESVVGQQMAPTLALDFTVDPTFGGDPFGDPWFGAVGDDWKQQRGAFSLTLSMPLDGLLPKSETRMQLADLDDQIAQTEIRLEQGRQAAELEIDSLVLNLRKSIASIETRELNVALAERAFALAEEAYNAGTQELLEVQSAELDLRQAQFDVLSEKYRYIAGLFDLEYALNTTVEDLR